MKIFKKINYNWSRLRYSFFSVKKLPIRLMIDTTTRCQLNCIGCYVDKDRKSQQDFRFDIFKKIAEETKSYIKIINFSLAGEPFLNKDIFRMLKLSSECNIKTLINSNGELIGDIAEDIVNSNLTFLNVDFSGTTQEQLSSYRSGANYEKVINNLVKFIKIKSKLKSKYPVLSLEMLVTKFTVGSINDFKKLAKDIGIKTIFLKSLNLDFGKIQTDEVRWKLANKYLPEDPQYSRYFILDNKAHIKREIMQMPCPEIFENVTIFNDGSIGLCCADINKDYSYSNMETSNLKDLIFSKYFINLRKKALKRELSICQKCTFPGSFLFNRYIKL